VTAVCDAPVPNAKHYDLLPIMIDLIKDAPVTSANPPRAWVTYERSGLPGPRVVPESVNNELNPPLDSLVELLEGLVSFVIPDDVISHSSQSGFGLDLLPWDERATGRDSCPGVTSRSAIGKSLK